MKSFTKQVLMVMLAGMIFTTGYSALVTINVENNTHKDCQLKTIDGLKPTINSKSTKQITLEGGSQPDYSCLSLTNASNTPTITNDTTDCQINAFTPADAAPLDAPYVAIYCYSPTGSLPASDGSPAVPD